jgi:hypothetical protein
MGVKASVLTARPPELVHNSRGHFVAAEDDLFPVAVKDPTIPNSIVA